MAPGRRRGAKGVKTTTDLSLGDLVLAKVKGFPAWPAKVSRPEDWDRAPDPKKYFVRFFGTYEIAFVAPPDIQAFTTEAKNKLSARCQGKTVRYFAQAVKEISAEFEASHRKNLTGIRNEDHARNLASETNSIDSVANETMDTHGTDDTKPSSSDDANNNSSPSPYLGKKNKLSTNPTYLVESVLGSSPSSHPPDKEETHHDKGKDGCPDVKNELTNGHQPKLGMGQRRKHEGAMRRNSGTASSQEHISDGVPTKFSPVSNIKVSSTSKVGLDVGSNGKGKKLLKQKRHFEAADNVQVDSEGINEEHKEVIPRKKMKFQHDHEKHISRTNDMSSPAKTSKFSDATDDVRVLRAQGSRKNDSKDHVHSDDKISDAGSKRLKFSGKDEVQRLKAQKGIDASNDSANEDDFPPLKCHRRAPDSSSSLLPDNRSESLTSHKNGLGNPNKILSPVVQQSTKRRAVRICDDDDDELPKTPIHGGSTHKVSDNPPVPDSKKKNVVRSESNVNDKLVFGKLRRVDIVLKEQEQSSLTSDKVSTPTSQPSMEKSTREPSVSVQQVSLSPPPIDLEGKTLKDTKSIIVSPKGSPGPINATRPLAEPQKKHVFKGHGSNSQKKAASVGDRGLATSKKSELSLNQSIIERNKLTSAEKRKIAPKTDSHVNLVVDNLEESTSPVERLNVGKDIESSLQVNMKNTDSVVSMKHLIAAAQARKKQANLQHLRGNSVPLLVTDVDKLRQSPSPAPATLAVESNNKLQRDAQGIHSSSPPDVHQLSSVNEHENGELEERRLSSSHQASGSSLSGGTEAAVARDAFEGMIETLSRTKESIGRATRLAIDCAKYGIANEIVELLVRKLENEASLHRKVDLFFLVDSITQCSHGQKGVAGAAYIPTVQAALPRLIGAAAPPGQGALENRRQCHKVLRLWVERKILPESVLRRFMDDMGARNDDTSAGLSLRRPSRAERAIDDPIREMEGMLVDEYGSNATFQLPGFLARHVFEEEEDEDNFSTNFSKEAAETSLSKHTPSSDPESCSVTPVDGRHCILEDVDGELEMEDVSGNQKVEKPQLARSTNEVTSIDPKSIVICESALATSELLPSPEGSPPLPPDSPPLTPPLPTSPPPSSSLPPPPPPPSSPPPPPPPSSPPPPPPPPSSQQHLVPLPPVGPPPLLSNQSLPPQSTFMSQCMPSHPPTVSSSQPLAYCPPPLPHEIGGAASGNQDAHMVSNIEHGQGDLYITSQTSQHRQSYVPGSSEPFAQRPLHLEPPPQRTTSNFSYPNSVQQHQYPPYPLANFSDGPRRYAGVNTGYFGPTERPPISSINFPPSAANSVPAATPIPGDVSGNGVPMMPFKPDISAINWRPAMHE